MTVKKKKLKGLIGFYSAYKIENNNRVGKKRENPKESIERSKIRVINVFLESLLSESFPSLGVTVHLTSLQHCAISGPAVGATQILISSYSYVFLPLMSTAM